MQEEIVSGKKFRRLIDGATDKWQRISFWTKASDCIMEDKNGNETTVENEIQDIRELIEDNKTANEDLKKQLLVYNEDTDYYQGFVDGNWKDVVYAGLNDDGYLVKDGKLLYKPHLGGYFISHNGCPRWWTDTSIAFSYTPDYPLNLSYRDNSICASTLIYNENKKYAGSLFSSFPINLSNYNKVTIRYSLGYSTPYNSSYLAYIGFTRTPFCNKFDNHGFTSLLNNESGRIYECHINLTSESGYAYLAISIGDKKAGASTYIYIYDIKFE